VLRQRASAALLCGWAGLAVFELVFRQVVWKPGFEDQVRFVDLCDGEAGSVRQVRAFQVGTAEERTVQLGAGEVRVVQMGAEEERTVQVGVVEESALQVGVTEDRATQVSPS
jgi:cytochrome b